MLVSLVLSGRWPMYINLKFDLTSHVTTRHYMSCRAHIPTFPPILVIFLRKLPI